MNPQAGPAGWIKGLAPATQTILSGVLIVAILSIVGLVFSMIAGSYARSGALQPAQ